MAPVIDRVRKHRAQLSDEKKAIAREKDRIRKQKARALMSKAEKKKLQYNLLNVLKNNAKMLSLQLTL